MTTAQPPGPTGALPSVLVVDDEEAVRELLAEVLGNWGYRVAVASTAREAIELLRNQLFEVAICDIHMPETNGIELLRQMKRHDPSIEVLMMTGDPTVPTTRETLKLGAFDYLPKPLDLAVQALAELLSMVVGAQDDGEEDAEDG